MSKKKHAKKGQPAAASKNSSDEATSETGPYLPVAHPPAKRPVLLVISLVLFVSWLVFLLVAAFSSSSSR